VCGSFRNTPKIIFRNGGVKTIDKLIARSFDIFHCVPFLQSFCRDSSANFARCVWLCIATLRQLWGKGVP
jgi:hypothetical protein